MLIETDPPLTREKFQSIIEKVKNRFPPSETAPRIYFQVSLDSLFNFVTKKEGLKKNFTLCVGKYDRNFDAKHANVGLSFDKRKIDVTIRVRGGFNLVQKVYMATSLGIARIDFLHKSAKVALKVGGKTAVVVGNVVTFAQSGGVGFFGAEEGGESATLIGKDLKEYVKNQELTFNKRCAERLTTVTAEQVLNEIPQSAEDRNAWLDSGAIDEAAAQLFIALDTDKSGTVELKEFSEPFCRILQLEENEVAEMFDIADTGRKGKLSGYEFSCFFREFMKPDDPPIDQSSDVLASPTSSDSEEEREDAFTAPQQRNLDYAKGRVLSLFKLPTEEAHELLNNADDFDTFTRGIFQIIDANESGSMDRREFDWFFCGALGMSTEVCRSQFELAFGAQEEVSYTVFAAFFKSFISARIAKEAKFLFWSKQVNKWLHLSSAEELNKSGSSKYFLSVARSCLKGLHTSGLSQVQMQLLDQDLVSATLLWPKEDPNTRFQQLTDSQAVITAEKYATFVQTAFEQVRTFKEDWDFVLHEEEQARLIWNDTAALVNCYVPLIAHFQTSPFRLARACPLLRSILSTHPDPLSVQELAALAAQTIERSRSQGLAAYSRELFDSLTSVPEPHIGTLLEQEYHLEYIALSVFSLVHPYQQSHEKSTFERYAGSLAQAFGYSEEATVRLFDTFQEKNVISPRQLVLILKDCLRTKIQAN